MRFWKNYFLVYATYRSRRLGATTRAYHANRQLQNLRGPRGDQELLQVGEAEQYHSIRREPAGPGDGAALQGPPCRPQPEAVPADAGGTAGLRIGEGRPPRLREAPFGAPGDEEGGERDDPD